MLKLLSPKGIAWTEAAIIVLVLAFVWNNHQRMKTERAEFETVRSSLEHPKIVERVKTVTIQGPVRIITKIVEKPSGEKETTIDENREEVREANDESLLSTPVALISIMPRARTDRFLLTFGLNRLSKDLDGKALFAGYSIKNRVDLQAGVIKKETTSPWLLLTIRL